MDSAKFTGRPKMIMQTVNKCEECPHFDLLMGSDDSYLYCKKSSRMIPHNCNGYIFPEWCSLSDLGEFDKEEEKYKKIKEAQINSYSNY